MRKSSIDIGRLQESVRASLEDLRPFRDNRREFVRMYAGENYGHGKMSTEKTPMDMLELAVSTYLWKLDISNPCALVETDVRKYRPFAGNLALALDYTAKQIGLGDTVTSAVEDALFSVGIVKVGINDSPQPVRGFTHEGGVPWVSCVSLDDFVFDTTAKTFEQCQYFGNRMYLDRDAAEKSGNYSNLDQVNTADTTQPRNESDTPQALTTGRPRNASQYRDRIVVWEFWLPYENVIVTTDEDVGVILREEKWIGPECGPFHMLRFNRVPDNIMPLPPVALWADIHKAANGLWRKIFRQADRQKTILPFAAKSEEDARRVQNSSDGDVVHVDDPKSLQELNFGGPRQEIMGLALQLESIFSRYAGNLDIAGGLSPMGQTASQDAILNQNSGVRFASMAARVQDFCAGIMKSLAFWLWTDETLDIPLVKTVNPYVSLDVHFTHQSILGQFLDYNFKIQPYSMARMSPAEKAAKILEVLAGAYQPYAQIFAQAGIQMDPRELMRVLSSYLGLPELDGILDYRNPAEDGEMEVGKPPTHSIYERVSRPGASYAQQSNAMAREMMGARIQPAERTEGRSIE